MYSPLRATVKRQSNIRSRPTTQRIAFSTTIPASALSLPLEATARLRWTVPGPRSQHPSGSEPSCQVTRSLTTSPVWKRAKETTRVEEPDEERDEPQYTVNVTSGESDYVTLTCGGRPDLKLSRVWLRDACLCEKCVGPSSGQKRFSTYDVPMHLPIINARSKSSESVEVTWKDDFFTHEDHVSVYGPTLLQSLFARGKTLLSERAVKLWDRCEMDSAPFFDYDDFIQHHSGFNTAFKRLVSHGMFYLRNVPNDETAVERIAAKIGFIQETFYGRTWDVVSKPNAENVAYTNSYLGLHADLLYMKDPPRIQLLHCMKNTCEGGESIFSDGLRAAKQLQSLDPEAYNVLTQIPVHYHYTKGVHQRESYRPILSDGPLPDIFWSPPFQNPAQLHLGQQQGDHHYMKWLYAAHVFKELLEAEKYQHQHKMKAGECVVFNNLRVLHGRREFDTSTGDRWLKGTYIGTESYLDKTRELEHLLDYGGS